MGVDVKNTDSVCRMCCYLHKKGKIKIKKNKINFKKGENTGISQEHLETTDVFELHEFPFFHTQLSTTDLPMSIKENHF